MDARLVTPFISVAPQITPADVRRAAEEGFRSIINNRPDGEAAGQPSSEEIATAAAEQGLAYRHVPAVSGKLTEDDVAAFAKAVDELEAPVLAYCRTGTRSIILWALSQSEKMEPSEIVGAAASAGYDLGNLEPHLRERYEAARSD